MHFFTFICFAALFGLANSGLLTWINSLIPGKLENADDSIVEFHVKLECNRLKKTTYYCVYLKYLEDDGLENDIVKDDVPRVCTNKRFLSQNIQITYTGGDAILWDNNYEPLVQVVHNCSGAGGFAQTRIHSISVDRVPVGMKTKVSHRTIKWDFVRVPVKDYIGLSPPMPLYIRGWGKNLTIRSPFTADDVNEVWKQWN